MTEIYYLGPCPSEEEASQSTDPDFAAKNRAECQRYIAAIKRVCGEPPKGVALRIKAESHDYGTYREVVVEFNGNNPAAAAYAAKCDEHAPRTWAEAETAPDRQIRFQPGTVSATVGALEIATNEQIAGLLARHLSGDWGDVDAQDAQANEQALKHGMRILSSYRVGNSKLWLITEADRSATTVLTPGEY